MPITDEMLMAYVDGELAPADMAQVENAMATDDALAERAAVFADTRRAVKQAHGTAPAVPDDLVARVRQLAAASAVAGTAPTNVVDLASRRKRAAGWQLGIAASVALAIGLAGGWFAARTGPAQVQQLAGFGDPAILDAVARLPSGSAADLAGGARVSAIATFRTAEDELCREYEYKPAAGTGYVAIVCNTTGNWDLRFAVANGTAGTGYTPASSLDALDAYLTASEAGQPMSLADEAAALAAMAAD